MVCELDSMLRTALLTENHHIIRDAFLARFVESVSSISEPTTTDLAAHQGMSTLSDEEKWQALHLNRHCLPEVEDIASRLRRLAVVFARAAKQMQLRMADPFIANRGALTHVRIMVDMHLRGAAATLYIANRPDFVYKPRSLATEAFFESILAMLRETIPASYVPNHPQFVNMAGYGFQEFVPYSAPKGHEGLQ
ncbi:DUF4135 domain-containing protein [Rathayibacter toxicus]|nr:DUF4135 domain-containing protein [Rathayibacter toxicus]QWL51087.1 DUF4135 domain-containing protein [Rathayibacter toxicus]